MTHPPKPSPLSLSVDNIPMALKERDQWVVWRYQWRNDKNGNGKWTKPPFNARTERYGKSNNPSTWVPFDVALDVYKRGQFDGIGFALDTSNDIVGLDLDHCIKADGTLKNWAQDVVDHFPNAYWERSPGGEGLRGFCLGTPQRSGKSGPNNWIEVYQPPSNRYLTVTGQHLKGTSSTVQAEQGGLDWLHERHFEKQAPAPGVSSPVDVFDDSELIRKAEQAKDGPLFSALMRGDISYNNNNPSAADLALCNLLAFWTQKDPFRMDRLFRQSGLMRDKWDEVHYSNGETHGQHTIKKAIAGCGDVYQPRPLQNKSGKGWKQLLRHRIKEDGNKGALLKTPANIAMILFHDERWQGVLGFDEFQNTIVLLKPLPSVEGLEFPAHQNGRPIQDADLFAVRCWLSGGEYNLNVSESAVAGAINLVANKNKFHPIRDYLDGLTWDGTPRLHDWLLQYANARAEGEDGEAFVRMVGRLWMIQSVARIYRPGCKADYVLILEGEQGVNKSMALKALAGGDYFDDTPFYIGNKDAYLNLQGTWIYEIGELDSLMRAESSAAKAFFTSAFDKYRPPYGRHTVKVARQCVFAGTVNGNEYIKDRTGGRRYWPVWCESIDLDALKKDRAQLWAEAVNLFHRGERWWPEGEAQHKLCKAAQDLRILDDPWEAKIAEYIEGRDEVTVGAVLEYGLGKDAGRWTKSDEIRIGQLLIRWGWRRKRCWTEERTNLITVYTPSGT